MPKNQLAYKANLSRHSHDISATYASSLCAGPIVPQYFHILGPGDAIYFNANVFARLQNVITAFLGRLDLHIDYFFVPLQMMYTPFGQFFANTDDFVSNFFQTKNNLPNIVPSLSVFDTIKDLDLPLENHYQFGNTTLYGDSVGKELMRLFDALNYNSYSIFHSEFNTDLTKPTAAKVPDILCSAPDVTPWLFGAYQCIYQNYEGFRNDSYEKRDINSYNFDDSYQTTNFRNYQMLRLRYCERYADYFTTLRPSPIASIVNDYFDSNNESQDALRNYLNLSTKFLGVTEYDESPLITGVEEALGVPSNISIGSSVLGLFSVDKSNVSYVSAQNIRAIFALDKYARIYGRANKTYDDQMLAHFGVEIPHDVKHQLTHIRHDVLTLTSDPVYNTAITTNDGETTPLGEVGGQSQANASFDGDKFVAPVHGVFMAVAYLNVRPYYAATFSPLHVLPNRYDYPIPSFDNLGAQPLYDYTFDPVALGTNYRSRSKGWTNRYQAFKKKFDRISSVFVSEYDINITPYEGANVYSPWVISRSAFPIIDDPNRTWSFNFMHLKTSPSDLDTIMVTPYDRDWKAEYYENPHLVFQTDPLLLDFHMQAKLVSWMSETGDIQL